MNCPSFLVTTATQRKHTPLQLVTTETKGEKGTSFGNFWDRGQKGRDVWVFQVKGLYAWATLSGELFESFWFPSFLIKKENRSYLLFFISLERVFSVYTTQLTRCVASSMQNENKICVNVGFFRNAFYPIN